MAKLTNLSTALLMEDLQSEAQGFAADKHTQLQTGALQKGEETV